MDYTGRLDVIVNSVQCEIVGKELRATGDGEITFRAVQTVLEISKLERWELKSVVINEGITAVGEKSFASCDGIEKVSFPNSLTEIKKNGFYACRKLKSVVLPSVKSVDQSAFQLNDLLETISLPNTLTYIGESAFSDCPKVQSIKIPNSVSFLGPWAFVMDNSAKELVFEEGIKISRIPKWCFSQLLYITELHIPDSVIEIAEGAFYHCPLLKEIKLSANMQDIGDKAFGYNNALTSFTYLSSIVPDGKDIFYEDGLLKYISVTTSYPSDTFSGFPAVKNASFVLQGIKTDVQPEESNIILIISISLFCACVIIGVVIFIAFNIRDKKKIIDINNEALITQQ